MYIKYAAVIILLFTAFISDLKTCKIKNKCILLFSVSGCLINLIIYGRNGLVQSIAGFFLPIILLFILFALKMMGAGDIKLFAAIGSIMGIRFVAYNMAYSFMAGGIIAFIIILLRKNAAKRLKELAAYLKSCFLCLSFLDYNGFKRDKQSAFRFTYAIVPIGLVQATLMTFVH